MVTATIKIYLFEQMKICIFSDNIENIPAHMIFYSHLWEDYMSQVGTCRYKISDPT